MQQDRD